MAQIPAICHSCGKTFASGIVLEGSGYNNQFTMNVGCPFCGGRASIVSGTYNHENGVISLVKVLTSPGMTAEKIAQIQQILEDARRAGSSEENIKARLEGVGEGFSKLLDFTNRSSGLGTWIGTALAALAFAYQVASSNGQVSEDDVRRIVNEQQQQHQVVPAAPVAPRVPFGARAIKLREPAPTAFGQPSQGAPCPCGSGKKFKHCHGQKRWQI